VSHRIASSLFRVGSVMQVTEVLCQLGLDPQSVMSDAGLTDLLLDDPETLLPLQMLDNLVSTIETASECDHVGFLVGRIRGHLGLPEFLLRHAPTLRQGFIDFIDLINGTNRAGGLHLHEFEGEATLGYEPVIPGLRTAGVFSDYAIAQLNRMLLEARGPDFKATEVWLPRKPPANTIPYRTFYGVMPRFNAVEASIKFSSDFLDEPAVGADLKLYSYLLRRRPNEHKVSTLVTRILPAMILRGKVSKTAVAQALDLHPRTLHRKLAADGSTFQFLLNTVRGEMGRHRVENTSLSLSTIAIHLGYSDLSAFSRHFRELFGESPQKWRQRQSAKESLGSESK
jgi:AraC-like DNA-binding protein